MRLRYPSAMTALAHSARGTKQLIAHRGACAYAPEHTLASYRLALHQGADYVEQDLAVTKDHVLICVHDDSLARTTNVAEVFPDRATLHPVTKERQWLAVDFTLAEIKQLDAGTWFDRRFAGEQIPTWEEAVGAVGSAAGLYPELKTPALYVARGIDQTALFVESLKRLGLHTRPDALIVQSFDVQPLKDLSSEFPAIGRTFLCDVPDGPRWLSAAGLAEATGFATGIAPDKTLLDGRPDLIQAAHAAGLTVTPWTFTTRGGASTGRFASLTDEMRYYLSELDVDAVFTDNPDRFPRE
jgi:glycerophosphoryl diester phosphodiesterase